MRLSRLLLSASLFASSLAAALGQSTTTNIPPTVTIVTPTNGATFRAPTNIFVMANAIDRDGEVSEVSFFANERYIGGVTNPPPDLSPLPPWRIWWNDVAAGSYYLRARAVDKAGGIGWSPVVRIEVRGTNQPPPEQIVLTIEAADGIATEQDPRLDAPTDDALLLVRRHGPTNVALHVIYRVGGSASNGVDYTRLTGELSIPAGARSAGIEISAIDDLLVEGTETVFVQLMEPACIAIFPPPPECYRVGSPGAATAYIRDNDFAVSNVPPMVRITAPTNNAVFPAGADIAVEVVTTDPDGYAPMVELYADGRKIGEQLITFIQAPPDGTPIHFSFVWSNVVAGAHTLAARATDDDGAMRWSEPVRIFVGTNPPPSGMATVTIETVDAIATEPGLSTERVLPDNALLRVRRSGGETNLPLTVHYSIGGSASNGVDYTELTGEVVMPAGARSANLVIEAVDDLLVEGTETVIVELTTLPCITVEPPPPECYLVGDRRRATAYIRDNDFAPSNRPPMVKITAPVNGASFPPGSDVRIDATTVDADGYAPMAEFFADGRKIGEEVIQFVQPPTNGTPINFSFVWSNVVAGAHVLTVRATDDDGAQRFSEPVYIRVGTNVPPPPPPTNVVISIATIDAYASEGPWTNVWTTSTGGVRGTNTAAFVVRREGPTNEAVTVRYHIGGTASNGVDYVELPGEVTVPAGARGARITVSPLEDGLVEGIETVVLELALPGGEPPAYVLGAARRAAAIIADNEVRPRCVRLAGGLYHLCLPGADGETFRIESSSDLVHWSTLCTTVVADGALHVVDAEADGLPLRFYRAIPDETAAAE